MDKEDEENQEKSNQNKESFIKKEKKVEMEETVVNNKVRGRCIDRYISKQQSLIDRQITQTYDNAIWIEEHKIFEMLERKTSHADPELSCIFTYWKKRFRRYRARLCDKRKTSKYIDLTSIKQWAEQLREEDDIKPNEIQQIDILLEFIQSFKRNDLQVWAEKKMDIPSEDDMNNDQKHKLVSKKYFCKTFQQFAEEICEIPEVSDPEKGKKNLFLCCTRQNTETSLQSVTYQAAKGDVAIGSVDSATQIDSATQPLRSNKLCDLKQVLLMFAYAEEFRWWPPKPFSTVMFVIHLSMFLHMYYSSTSSHSISQPECSVLILNPLKPHEAWRYLSYSFVHFDIGHLTTNLLGIFIAGFFLEYTNKWWRIAPIFYSGVATAGIILTSISPQPLIGMSAGVYALMAGSIPDILLNWKDIKLLLRQRFRGRGRITQALPTRSIPAFSPIKCRQIRLGIPILWMFLDIGYSIYSMLGRCQKEFCGTSYESHIIGALTGLLVGFLWLKNRRFKTWVIVLKRILRYVLFLVIIGFLIALIYRISQSQPYSVCKQWIDGKCCQRSLETGLGSCCLNYLFNQNATHH